MTKSALEEKWRDYATKILKSEMGRTLTKSSDLAKDLNIDTHLLRKRINNGAFTAGFFIHALSILGTKEITIPHRESISNQL